MAWSALIRVWKSERRMYDTLILRIEATEGPGWLARLYDGDRMAGEATGDEPAQAIHEAVQLAQRYLNDTSIREQDLDWVQV